jgi:hypothetical protein
MHARAADMAESDEGERGMIATDLMPYLRELSNPFLYLNRLLETRNDNTT